MSEDVSAISFVELQRKLQDEYDRHWDNYRKGCHGCIVACWAIRDFAKTINIPIKETVASPSPRDQLIVNRYR